MATIEHAFQEFADAILAAEDEAGFVRVARRMTERLGFRWFAYLCQAGNVTTVVSSYPKPWTRRYIDFGYARLDPVVRRAGRGHAIFDWDGRIPKTAATRVQRNFFEEAATFGVKSGITVPIRGGFGQTIAFTLATDGHSPGTDRLLREAGDIIQLIGLYFHSLMATRLLASATGQVIETELTQRQRQCLTWASQGKTVTDIAVLVGVKPRTITYHLERARRRLGASTTTQCVGEALRRGLLR